jgi:antirestriction protein ArdC
MYEGIDQAKLGEEIENFVSFFDENKELFSKNVLTQPLVPYDIHLLCKSYINSKYGFSLETEPQEIRAMEGFEKLIHSIPDSKEKSVMTSLGLNFEYFDSTDLKGCTPEYVLQKFKTAISGHEHLFSNLIKYSEEQNQQRITMGNSITEYEDLGFKFTDLYSGMIEQSIVSRASDLSLLAQEAEFPKMKQEHSDIVFEPGEYTEGKYKKNDIQFSGETEKLFIKIGERLIERLETNDRSGIPFWEDPVFQLNSMNPKTGYKYGNENQVLLSDDTSARGFKAPLYMSFNDAINTGFAMPKGTKGTPIIQRFGMKGRAIETTSESGAVQPVLDTNGEPKHFWRRAAKTVTVFNIDQLEWKHEDKPDPRIKWIEEFKKPQFKAINNDELVAFRESYFKSIDIPVSRGGLIAYYLYAKNRIQLPESESFKSILQELSTAFHEDAHAQGHASKLNRQSLNDYHIDNAHRGFEELLVNVSAQQLVRHYGLDQNEQQKAYNANEDAYNLGWALPAFKKDPLLIVEAMRQSQQCFESMKTRIDAQLKVDNVYDVFCKPEPEKVAPAPLAPRHAYKNPANDESKNKTTIKPMRNAI